MRRSVLKIATPFLLQKYEEDRVRVNDLIYTREKDGWKLNKSFYYKVKVPLVWAVDNLEEKGFKMEVADCIAGLVTIIAVK